MEAPIEWSITNGWFIGYIMVDAPSDAPAVGFSRTIENSHEWLPYCIRVKLIAQVAQRTPDDDSAKLYDKSGEFIGTVNAKTNELIEALTSPNSMGIVSYYL